MRFLTFLAILAPLFMSAQTPATEPEVRVMTFNIRTASPKDGDNVWENRRDRVANAIKFYDADIVGMQEVRPTQLDDLAERLGGYNKVTRGRFCDNSTRDEHCTLWFKSSRFTLLDSGTFWISETPEVTASKGWDGAYPRIATWARLHDKISGRDLLAVNTHLDHRGQQARREGSRMLIRKVSELAGGLPVVLTGDFNANMQDVPYKEITDAANPDHLTDSRSVAPLIYGPDWSFHDFGRQALDKREIIDYLFVGGPVKVNRYGILAETEGRQFLSDHNPILISLSFM